MFSPIVCATVLVCLAIVSTSGQAQRQQVTVKLDAKGNFNAD